MTTILNEVQAYFDSLEQGNKSPNTIRTYKTSVMKFITHFSFSKISDIDKLTVADYFSFYNAQNLKPESLNGLIRNLSAFISWLTISSMISSDNAFHKVYFGGKKFVKKSRKEVNVLTKEQIVRIIKAGRNTQEKLMFTMMAFQGFRRDEVRKIHRNDIVNGQVKIVGKGDKVFIVSLHKTVLTMLDIYFAEKENLGYLFTPERGETAERGYISGDTVNNRLKDAMRRAGFSEEEVSKYHAHSLRHYFGTSMIEQFGFDIGSKALRHASWQTTKLYDHTQYDSSNAAITKQADLEII